MISVVSGLILSVHGNGGGSTGSWSGSFGLPPSMRQNVYQADRSGHSPGGAAQTGGSSAPNGGHNLGAQKPMNLGTLPHLGGSQFGGNTGPASPGIGGGLPPLSAGLNIQSLTGGGRGGGTGAFPGINQPAAFPNLGGFQQQQQQPNSALPAQTAQPRAPTARAATGSSPLAESLRQFGGLPTQHAPNVNAAGRLDALMSQKLAGYQGEEVLPPSGGVPGGSRSPTSGQDHSAPSSTMPSAPPTEPPPGTSPTAKLQHNTDPFLYLRDYFQQIVETSFSPQMQDWWHDFRSETGSSNMLQWKCREVLLLVYEVRRGALGESLLVREDFEQLIKHRNAKVVISSSPIGEWAGRDFFRSFKSGFDGIVGEDEKSPTFWKSGDMLCVLEIGLSW